MSLISIISTLNGSHTTTGGGGGGGGAPVPFITSGTILDDGNYSGFPMVSDAVDGTTYGILKRSATHAAAGTLPLLKTVDGGATWTANNLKVSGTDITSSNHSFLRLSSGRMLFVYRDTDGVHFGHSDDNSANITVTQTILASGDSTHLLVPSPVKMKVTPEGKIWWLYYKVPIGGATDDIIGIMESSDNGLTFTDKVQISTGHAVTSNPISDWGCNEFDVLCVENTGIDATSKWVCVARVDVPEGATYPRLFTSVDGGSTWTSDSTTDAGSISDDRGGTITSGAFDRRLLYKFNTPNPCSLALLGGTVYCFVGDRRTDGYRLMYITATVAGALRNKFDDWSIQSQVGSNYNAYTTAGDIDCGYPVPFTADGSIYIAHYDHSSTTPNTGVDKAEKSMFVKVITP